MAGSKQRCQTSNITLYSFLHPTFPIVRSVTGIPTPEISWRREGGVGELPPTAETLTGGVLRLGSVTRAEAGRYVCSGRNSVGWAEERVEVRVEDPPQLSLQPAGQVVLRAGARLTAVCHVVAGDPAPPQVSWGKYPE